MPTPLSGSIRTTTDNGTHTISFFLSSPEGNDELIATFTIDSDNNLTREVMQQD